MSGYIILQIVWQGYSKRHNKFLLPVLAKAIYGSFCKTESEISNIVNYRKNVTVQTGLCIYCTNHAKFTKKMTEEKRAWREKMNLQDYFKNSVWESFSSSQGLTGEFMVRVLTAMVMAVLIGILIYKIYGHYFGGVVFSSSFAVTLVGMTILSCMLTLAISSNIVISLGMVGALSIVRYRTAIKDPMDLLYLFWAISEGITLGAGVYGLALATLAVMLFIIHLFYNRRKKGTIFILVAHYETGLAGDEIIRTVKKMKHQLKAKTIRDNITELTLELLCKNTNTVFLEQIKEIEGVLDVTLIQYNGEYHG